MCEQFLSFSNKICPKLYDINYERALSIKTQIVTSSLRIHSQLNPWT
jgi:hypothetical protein